MLNLEDRLAEIRHQYLHLTPPADITVSDETPHRPMISVWASSDANIPHVSVCVHALYAQQARYADLTPEEARQLAMMLTTLADAIDRDVAAEPEVRVTC